ERLQPRRQIGSVANDGALLRGTCADHFADDDEAGGNADPRLDRVAVRPKDLANVGQDTDGGADGAFCRVLEGAWKAKVSQNAVAHEFGDESAESRDCSRGGVLIALEQISEQFGVKRA